MYSASVQNLGHFKVVPRTADIRPSLNAILHKNPKTPTTKTTAMHKPPSVCIIVVLVMFLFTSIFTDVGWAGGHSEGERIVVKNKINIVWYNNLRGLLNSGGREG